MSPINRNVHLDKDILYVVVRTEKPAKGELY